MYSYAFTFGSNTPYFKQFVLVEVRADNEAIASELARAAMIKFHGSQWAFQYDYDKDFKRIVRDSQGCNKLIQFVAEDYLNSREIADIYDHINSQITAQQA